MNTPEDTIRARFGPDCEVEKLQGDASTRIYYRLVRGASTSVVMDVGRPVDPAADPFIRAAALFAEIGLPVPGVLEVVGGDGLVLLEDLGDLLLQRRLADIDDAGREELYGIAIDHLLRIHVEGSLVLGRMPDHPAARETLDRERFLFEMEFMREHYLEGLCGAGLDTGETETLRAWFDELSAETASFGRVLCHRDYHSRNLMVHRGTLAIIDFQDARWGPVTYDIASLLRDAYVSLPEPFVDRLAERFRDRLARTLATQADESGDREAARGLARSLDPTLRDPVEFRRRFDMTCLQRNLKALGTFGFQLTVRRNDVYRRYLEPTAAHAARNFARFPEHARAFGILRRHGTLPQAG